MSNLLEGKKILLGVCGSIAAYKACELCSSLVKLGADVYVIMSKAASALVGSETFRALSGHPVTIDTFDMVDDKKINHIYLAENADLLLIAPASANSIAKMRLGLADTMLTDVYLACTCPTLIAPAMNTNMWYHPSTQENLAILKSRGVHFSGPVSGNLACKTEGLGKFKEPKEILEDIKAILGPKKAFPKKVLVTAGASFEDIDPVRFLSNRSTGKMGHAIAEAAAQRGAEVTLLTSNASLAYPGNCDRIPFRSSAELFEAVSKLAPSCDVVIQAAAPADYTVVEYSTQKIKKSDTDMLLQLKRTKDIAAHIGMNKKPNQIFVGFAAETENTLENAKQKLVKKNLDLIILNNVTQEGAGFEVDTNIASIITKSKIEHLDIMKKTALADLILDRILDIFAEEK